MELNFAQKSFEYEKYYFLSVWMKYIFDVAQNSTNDNKNDQHELKWTVFVCPSVAYAFALHGNRSTEETFCCIHIPRLIWLTMSVFTRVKLVLKIYIWRLIANGHIPLGCHIMQ